MTDTLIPTDEDDSDECPICGRSDRHLLITGPDGMPHAAADLSMIVTEGRRLAWNLAAAAGDDDLISAVYTGLEHNPADDPITFGQLAQAALMSITDEIIPALYAGIDAVRRNGSKVARGDILTTATRLNIQHDNTKEN